jgi:hypothetical protein
MPPIRNRRYKNGRINPFDNSRKAKINEIEQNLRYMLHDIFDDNRYFKESYFKRTKDVAEIKGFGNKKLMQIFYWDSSLNLNPLPVPKSNKSNRQKSKFVKHASRCFGRRIKDWVNLVAWRQGDLDFRMITPGLELYVDGLSFRVDLISGSDESRIWTVDESDFHEISELPNYSGESREVFFEDVPEEATYAHFFEGLMDDCYEEEGE